MQERVTSIHEASCVLISYLCELSSKARVQISHSEGVVENLVSKVLCLSDIEVRDLAVAWTAGGRGGAAGGGNGEGGAAARGGEDDVSAVAAGSSQAALVTMLGDLMRNVGPDNFVFKAAMHAMQTAKRHPGVAGFEGDAGMSRTTLISEASEDRCASRTVCFGQGDGPHTVLDLLRCVCLAEDGWSRVRV